MDKQIVTFSDNTHHGILHSKEEIRYSHTQQLGESHRQHVEWKKGGKSPHNGEEAKLEDGGWGCGIDAYLYGTREFSWDARNMSLFWVVVVGVCHIHWKDWCWGWNSNTLATWCEELNYWKRPWCWERFKAGGEGDDRGWDGWMASPTRSTWVWASSRSWWWTGKPGVLQSMES